MITAWVKIFVSSFWLTGGCKFNPSAMWYISNNNTFRKSIAHQYSMKVSRKDDRKINQSGQRNEAGGSPFNALGII